MKKSILCLMLITTILITHAQTIYTLDKNHAKLGFSVKHFGISHIEGQFKNFTSTVTAKKEDLTDAVIEMIAEVNSIDTDNNTRNNDLKSESWFDAAKFPTIAFKSTSFKKVDDKNYKLYGNITMHGITKPITLDVVYNGKEMNPITKKYSAGFTVTGKLNRKDFLVGTGGSSSFVADEVDLRSNVEFIIENAKVITATE